MLVLTRDVGQSVVIGDELIVTVARIEPPLITLSVKTLSTRERRLVRMAKGERMSVPHIHAEIELVDVRGVGDTAQARIGFEAPRDVSVMRAELRNILDPDALGGLVEEVPRGPQNPETVVYEFSVDEETDASAPIPQIAVDFGEGFTEEEIAACLSYVSEVYRFQGGVGLKVVGNNSLVFESEGVPNGD